MRLGVIRYRPQKLGETPYAYLWQPEPVPLTAEWQQIALEYSVWEPEFQRMAFCIEVQGEKAAALLDDAAVESLVPAGVGLTVAPEHPMLPAGGSCDHRPGRV